MKIVYTNTEDEVLDYTVFEGINSKSFADETKSLKNMYVVLAAVFGLWGIVNIAAYLNSQNANRLATGVSTLVVAIFTLFFTNIGVSIRKYVMRREIKRKIAGKKIAETTIDIDSRNLNWKCGEDSGTIKLTEEIRAYDYKNLYIINAKKSRLAIPRRAFKNDEELNRFNKMFNMEHRLSTDFKK